MHRHVRIKADLAKSVFRGGGYAKALTFDLKPDFSVTFNNSATDSIGKKVRVWSGRAEGPEDGSATLIYRRGGVVGQLQIGVETYRITPTSGL